MYQILRRELQFEQTVYEAASTGISIFLQKKLYKEMYPPAMRQAVTGTQNG